MKNGGSTGFDVKKGDVGFVGMAPPPQYPHDSPFFTAGIFEFWLTIQSGSWYHAVR
jgi:hypothetical protein